MGRGYYLKSGFREVSRTQIELDFFNNWRGLNVANCANRANCANLTILINIDPKCIKN